MVLKSAALVLVALLAAPAALQPGPLPQQPTGPAQSERVRNGIGHFDRAFYELVPQNRKAEASVEFDRAIALFEAELTASPGSVAAHRYLARIRSARKEHRAAATHYEALIRLLPQDVDVCVLAALAYLDASEPDEARLRLVEAMDRTLDPAVLERLREYVAKVDALKR